MELVSCTGWRVDGEAGGELVPSLLIPGLHANCSSCSMMGTLNELSDARDEVELPKREAMFRFNVGAAVDVVEVVEEVEEDEEEGAAADDDSREEEETGGGGKSRWETQVDPLVGLRRRAAAGVGRGSRGVDGMYPLGVDSPNWEANALQRAWLQVAIDLLQRWRRCGRISPAEEDLRSFGFVRVL